MGAEGYGYLRAVGDRNLDRRVGRAFELAWVAAAALAILVANSAQALADPAVQGITKYKEHSYLEAAKFFQEATVRDPYDARAHYYLANSWMYLRNSKQAVREYQACFDLDPLSAYGQNARRAILGLGKAYAGCVRGAVAEEDHERVAPDTPHSIKQAVNQIRKETQERENINRQWGEGIAKASVTKGALTEAKITRDTDLLVFDLNPNNNAVSADLQLELNEIKQKGVFAGQRARQDAQQQATRHMTAAAQKSTLVENSATNLLSLIAEDPRPGHVKMKALGTNLYVRNYGTEKIPVQEPLLASWETMNKRPVSKGEHDTTGGAIADVYGKLVNQK